MRDLLRRFRAWFGRPRPRAAALAAVDYGLPLGLGLFMVACLWVTDIQYCRGWESWDPRQHLIAALDLYHAPNVHQLMASLYPPLVYLWSALLFSMLDPGRQVAELSVALFYLPLALGIYSLARHHGGRAAGLLSLALVCFCQPIYERSQDYLLDVPLLTLVTLTLLAWVKSRMFASRGWSLALGLVLGMGLLVKYNFFYFCFPLALSGAYLLIRCARPALLVGAAAATVGSLWLFWGYFESFRRQGPDSLPLAWYLPLAGAAVAALYLASGLLARGRLAALLIKDQPSFQQLRHAGLAGMLGLLPALPWYYRHFPALMDNWRMNRVWAQRGGDGLPGYLEASAILWAGAAPMVLAGLVLLVKRYPGRLERALLTAGGVIALALLAGATDWQLRLLLPLVPFIVVLGTWWLRLLGRWSWVAALVVLALQVPHMFSLLRPFPPITTTGATPPAMGDGSLMELPPPERRPLPGALKVLSPAYLLRTLVKAPTGQNEGPGEAQRCRVARRLLQLSSATTSGGQRPRILCAFSDREQEEAFHINDAIPGFDCNVLSSVFSRPSYPSCKCTLAAGEDTRLRRKARPDRQQERWLLMFPAPRAAKVATFKQAFARRSTGRLEYLRYHPLTDKNGLHLFRLDRAGEVACLP